MEKPGATTLTLFIAAMKEALICQPRGCMVMTPGDINVLQGLIEDEQIVSARLSAEIEVCRRALQRIAGYQTDTRRTMLSICNMREIALKALYHGRFIREGE